MNSMRRVERGWIKAARNADDSPCVRNCCLDDHDICLGCGRHLSEILAWHGATAEERAASLVNARQRMESRARGL